MNPHDYATASPRALRAEAKRQREAGRDDLALALDELARWHSIGLNLDIEAPLAARRK